MAYERRYANRPVVEGQPYQGADWRPLADFDSQLEAEAAMQVLEDRTPKGSGVRYRIRLRRVRLEDFGRIGQEDGEPWMF